jgi:hypothetical protein
MHSGDGAPDRLFAIVSRADGRLQSLCGGPSEDGTCPNADKGMLPCAGTRVVPMAGTDADGLPFSVPAGEHAPRCPLAWVDEEPQDAV